MRGVLFKNERKEEEKHPDYTGKIQFNHVEHWLSAWIKQGRKGKFLSISIGAPTDQRTKPPPHKSPHEVEDENDDDIPF